MSYRHFGTSVEVSWVRTVLGLSKASIHPTAYPNSNLNPNTNSKLNPDHNRAWGGLVTATLVHTSAYRYIGASAYWPYTPIQRIRVYGRPARYDGRCFFNHLSLKLCKNISQRIGHYLYHFAVSAYMMIRVSAIKLCADTPIDTGQ